MRSVFFTETLGRYVARTLRPLNETIEPVGGNQRISAPRFSTSLSFRIGCLLYHLAGNKWLLVTARYLSWTHHDRWEFVHQNCALSDSIYCLRSILAIRKTNTSHFPDMSSSTSGVPVASCKSTTCFLWLLSYISMIVYASSIGGFRSFRCWPWV